MYMTKLSIIEDKAQNAGPIQDYPVDSLPVKKSKFVKPIPLQFIIFISQPGSSPTV